MSKHDIQLIFNRLLAKNDTSTTQVSEPKVRKACVAAIIRWKPYTSDNITISNNTPPPTSVSQFLNEPWVNDCHGEAEMLFIKRAQRPGDFWSGHVAFPGGKDEPSDKDNFDTVVRECREEVGLDLSNLSQYISLGTLKHRNIRKMGGHGELMLVLYPFVFLQLIPDTPKLIIQTSEVAETHWIPIRYLLTDPVVPYAPADGGMIALWPNNTQVSAIPLITKDAADTNKDPSKIPYLWGMTLRITQEILGMKLSPHAIMSAEEAKEPEDEDATAKI